MQAGHADTTAAGPSAEQRGIACAACQVAGTYPQELLTVCLHALLPKAPILGQRVKLLLVCVCVDEDTASTPDVMSHGINIQAGIVTHHLWCSVLRCVLQIWRGICIRPCTSKSNSSQFDRTCARVVQQIRICCNHTTNVAVVLVGTTIVGCRIPQHQCFVLHQMSAHVQSFELCRAC